MIIFLVFKPLPGSIVGDSSQSIGECPGANSQATS
jgi:hypothetical protein